MNVKHVNVVVVVSLLNVIKLKIIIVFFSFQVGINPGLYAAFVGHHYAGPGNHFCKYFLLIFHLSASIPSMKLDTVHMFHLQTDTIKQH